MNGRYSSLNLKVVTLYGFTIRYVIAYGMGGKLPEAHGLRNKNSYWLRPCYKRVEVTKDGKYIFSWKRWRNAEQWVRKQNAKRPKS